MNHYGNETAWSSERLVLSLDSFFERASLDSHEWAECRVDRVVLINVIADSQDACKSIDIKISNLDV